MDGQLGPLTTQSIKAAQKRLGLKQDGQVTPQLYTKLLALKALPGHRAEMSDAEWRAWLAAESVGGFGMGQYDSYGRAATSPGAMLGGGSDAEMEAHL